MQPIRVLIVDDNSDVVSALTAFLSRLPEIGIVDSANDPDQAREVARRLRPHVALVDVVMPGGGGLRATRLLREVSPTTSVLIHSGASDENAVLEMLREGAIGYVPKVISPDRLASAILETARGVSVLAADVAHSVMRELKRSSYLDESQRIHEGRRVEDCLREQQFHIALQPIVDLTTRRVVGLEALSRFDAGTPDEWFARAWSTGRGQELEMKALQLAVDRMPDIPPDLYLSLNLSPATLSDRETKEVLLRTDPSRLVIEITEHAQIEDLEIFKRNLDEVRELGVRVAVDDAGAGFANFVRLLQVVPNIIKLDRVLVADIDKDPIKIAIAHSLIDLAEGISAEITGEGVETEEEARTLAELGVRCGQGYLFGRPSESVNPERAAPRRLKADGEHESHVASPVTARNGDDTVLILDVVDASGVAYRYEIDDPDTARLLTIVLEEKGSHVRVNAEASPAPSAEPAFHIHRERTMHVKLPSATPQEYLRWIAFWREVEGAMVTNPALEEFAAKESAPFLAGDVAIALSHAGAQITAQAQAARARGARAVRPKLALPNPREDFASAMAGFMVLRGGWLDENAEAIGVRALEPELHELRLAVIATLREYAGDR